MSTEAHDSSSQVDGTQVDKTNTGALGTLVAVGLFAMLSITAAVTALVRHDMEVEESEKDSDANAVVIGLKNSQRGMLNGPSGYVDRSKGVVSLPIDLAKSLVLSDLQRDPNSATPAPPPKAQAAPEAAAAAATPDAGVTSTGAGAKVEPLGKREPAQEKASQSKLAPATSAKPASVTSAAPVSLPKPTPTAATPGYLSPGPLNH